MVRIQTLAYLSGFPSSFKDTEQLRVKLPSVLTAKTKQVRTLGVGGVSERCARKRHTVSRESRDAAAASQSVIEFLRILPPRRCLQSFTGRVE